MGRHAFLIICHKSDYNLHALIKSIDSEQGDIFLLVDKKAKSFDFQSVKSAAKFSNIIFVPRIKVVWGGYSLVKAEMVLFEFAKNYGEYEWYHLLSGVDMCIKSKNEFFEFFENKTDKIFIDFSNDPNWIAQAHDRIKYYRIQAGRNTFLARLNKIYVMLQKLLGVNRIKRIDFEITGGGQWCSLPNSFVEYLITRKDWIRKVFRKSYCSDEIFMQTVVKNSEFYNNVYLSEDGVAYNMRHIDWTRGTPYVFNENDYEELLNSPAVFARKFTYSEDNKVVDMLLEHTGSNKQ